MSSPETDRAYRGLSADERRKDRRSRLVRAAVKLYGARGYANVGVRAICAEAGLTERYFYEAFENGEALAIASFEGIARVLFDNLETAILPHSAPRARLRAALSAWFGLVAAYPDEARFFLKDLDGVSPALEEVRRAVFHRFVALFGRIVGAEPGGSLLEVGAIGGVLEMAVVWMRGGLRIPVDTVVADAERLCSFAFQPQEVRS
ncbi:MAG: TetR/AcrR family transcriptional regulator [Caulobacteraceae bacterium]|nr:TetR/AcrR family transcriptional regulator [Caulobacteraceae bacterium]